jgi:hypothetical protein
MLVVTTPFPADMTIFSILPLYRAVKIYIGLTIHAFMRILCGENPVGRPCCSPSRDPL